MLIVATKPRVQRSAQWPALRAKLLRGARCAACGGRELLELHHVIPFHVDPARELDTGNLLPLCERKRSGINCHLLVGHLGDYRSWNEHARTDAAIWLDKFRSRP